MTGKVLFFNWEKKFGFVLDTETNQDYFTHQKYLLDERIIKDDKVTFDLKDDRRGIIAVNVKKI